MLTPLSPSNTYNSLKPAALLFRDASFPAPFSSGLEYCSPARGTWNIVQTGMLIPEAHEIFICPAGCLRGVVLTAAEMNAKDRFSTVTVQEENLYDGSMEELALEGISDILNKLPKCPPLLLVYTSCVHHFIGFDIESFFSDLRARFPHIEIVDCYMDPIMRKSGLTPDQLVRDRLYAGLKPLPRNDQTVGIIGNDLPMDTDSDLIKMLEAGGMRVREITRCKTYEDYLRMAEASCFISCNPAAIPGGEALQKRLGAKHYYLRFSYDPNEIESVLRQFAAECKLPLPDFNALRERMDEEWILTRREIGDIPIALDYTFCTRPLSLARFLLEGGLNLRRVYLDSISGEEKADFDFLQKTYSNLELYPTVQPNMRFAAGNEKVPFLAVGQKAAYFTGTDHFVNIVENGGMFGYEAIFRTLFLIRDAFKNEKDMRSLVQIKGLGCGGCQ